MITQIKNVPNNIVAFKAHGEVTQNDFDIVKQQVTSLVDSQDSLNYLLYLDTSVKDFTIGAWFQDALLGLQNITKWNRAAIVTDSEGVQRFTNIFSKVMPGEFRGFDKDNFDAAVSWVSGRAIVNS